MDEKQKSTYPRNFPIPPDSINEEKLALILERELVAWKVVQSPMPVDTFMSRRELFREFRFSTFEQAIEFMTKVAAGCDLFPHHPRWENTWTTLKVWLSTWDSEHIITYKDVMLARFMERIFAEYAPSAKDSVYDKMAKKQQSGFIEKMRTLIGKDQLDEAFEHFNLYAAMNAEKGINNDFILLSQRFRRIRKAERKNTQSREDINLEVSRISKALLEVLEELGED